LGVEFKDSDKKAFNPQKKKVLGSTEIDAIDVASERELLIL
jgi:hypothetical protein